MNRRTAFAVLAVAAPIAAAVVLALRSDEGRALARVFASRLLGKSTVDQRVAQHGADVERRLRPAFEAVGLPYPPPRLALVAFKDRRILEVHARAAESAPWQRVLGYPVRGLSGTPGPKLREGDRQVPEGIYQVESLNPNSRYHLALRLDYPNAYDRARAAEDGRSRLGGDIMIHGTASSVGCLAIGNRAAEDLFVLAALAGVRHVRVVVAPADLREVDGRGIPKAPAKPDGPAWLGDFYALLAQELAAYPPAQGTPTPEPAPAVQEAVP